MRLLGKTSISNFLHSQRKEEKELEKHSSQTRQDVHSSFTFLVKLGKERPVTNYIQGFAKVSGTKKINVVNQIPYPMEHMHLLHFCLYWLNPLILEIVIFALVILHTVHSFYMPKDIHRGSNCPLGNVQGSPRGENRKPTYLRHKLEKEARMRAALLCYQLVLWKGTAFFFEMTKLHNFVKY